MINGVFEQNRNGRPELEAETADGVDNAKFEWDFQIEFWLSPACSP